MNSHWPDYSVNAAFVYFSVYSSHTHLSEYAVLFCYSNPYHRMRMSAVGPDFGDSVLYDGHIEEVWCGGQVEAVGQGNVTEELVFSLK